MIGGRAGLVIITAMAAKRRSKPRRLIHRGRGYSVDRIQYGPEVGPGVSVASPVDVARALQDAPSPGDWDRMAVGIMPIFERRRPFPFDVGRPLRTILPPGVSVTIAYDLGPALMRVTREVAAIWPVTEADVVDRAMVNLRDRVEAALDGPDPVRPVSELLDDLAVRAIVSGEGWASTLLLVPDLLERLFGSGPCLFVAPMRDLLIAMPASTDIGAATWWTEEFESLDPNCLCLESFAWEGRELIARPLSREAATA